MVYKVCVSECGWMWCTKYVSVSVVGCGIQSMCQCGWMWCTKYVSVWLDVVYKVCVSEWLDVVYAMCEHASMSVPLSKWSGPCCCSTRQLPNTCCCSTRQLPNNCCCSTRQLPNTCCCSTRQLPNTCCCSTRQLPNTCCCSTRQLPNAAEKQQTNKAKRIRGPQDNKHCRPISEEEHPLLCCRNHDNSHIL